MKPYVISIAVVSVLVLGIFGLDLVLPYSFTHQRQIAAIALASSVRAQRGEYPTLYKTNPHSVIFPFHTNFQVRSVTFQTVIALQDSKFRNRGFMASTTNAEILWIDQNHRAQLLDLKTGRTETNP